MTLKTMFKGSSKNTYAVGSIGDLKKGGDRDKPVKDQVNAIFKEKGFEQKMDTPNGHEFDYGDPNWDIIKSIQNVWWDPVGLKMENASVNLHSSARALSKLGAFMANKGTFRGKTLISEETW